MIDLHCHILPGIDDGAVDLPMALEMARIAARDGITTIACTPHIYPGLYPNTRAGILEAISAFQARLDDEGIAMKLVEGADVHMDPDLPSQLAAGTIATLAGSRYILLEPPHHSAPPDFEGHVFELLAHGWQPLITHPERLRWVEDHYDSFVRLSQRGVWMQITAGALTGRFGARPRYWAEKFLDEGHCHVLATDAHHPQRRPPLLAEARDAAARRVGQAHADAMVLARPLAVIANELPERVTMPESIRPAPTRRAWWRFDRS